MWNKLNEDQRYFIETFNHLVNLNETITSKQLSERIAAAYDIKNPRIELALDTIKAMSFDITRAPIKGIGLTQTKKIAVYVHAGKFYQSDLSGDKPFDRRLIVDGKRLKHIGMADDKDEVFKVITDYTFKKENSKKEKKESGHGL